MMRIFALALGVCLLMQTVAAHAEDCGRMEPAWTACAADADCVVEFDACGWPAAYNRNLMGEVEKFNACVAPTVGCSRFHGEKPEQAVCVEGACALPGEEHESVED